MTPETLSVACGRCGMGPLRLQPTNQWYICPNGHLTSKPEVVEANR